MMLPAMKRLVPNFLEKQVDSRDVGMISLENGANTEEQRILQFTYSDTWTVHGHENQPKNLKDQTMA